jgi:hypothetical protein
MGRLIRLRRGRSPLHAVEETIAALHEELEFTTNFAHAMVREENYHAAATVIDEQRQSLARASERIERALRAPEIERARMRTRAALVGLAAVLALGSGAFAAFGPDSAGPGQSKVEAIQDFSDALEAAVAVSDPIALSAIVAPEQERILTAAKSAASDPEVAATLLDSVKQLQKVMSNPNLPAPVRERAKQVAETVQQIVVTAPVPDPESVESDAQTTEEAHSSAPAAPTP